MCVRRFDSGIPIRSFVPRYFDLLSIFRGKPNLLKWKGAVCEEEKATNKPKTATWVDQRVAQNGLPLRLWDELGEHPLALIHRGVKHEIWQQ
jgi:hypothetical protein